MLISPEVLHQEMDMKISFDDKNLHLNGISIPLAGNLTLSFICSVARFWMAFCARLPALRKQA
jgi:hypothetical protein